MLRHCTDPRERLAVVGAIGVYVLANRGSNVLLSSKHWVCRPVWGLVRKFGGCDQAWFSMCLMRPFGEALSVATVPAAISDMRRTNHMAGVFSAV